ncbi:MAG TPA: multiheme c-type cytochrome [Candidatus Brocadiaceae bacterium]
MAAKRYVWVVAVLCAFVNAYHSTAWADSQNGSGHVTAQSSNEFVKILPDGKVLNGKIMGKVLNTKGAPLSGITISIQPITDEMIYDETTFVDKAVTTTKGSFKISNLATGEYIVRATPPSDVSYLPNDVFKVKVEPKKTTQVILKLSAASPANAAYLGSKVCLSCHPDQKGWKKTAHANTIQSPSPKTVVAPFSGDIITTSDGKVKFKPFIENDQYKVTLYDVTNESVFVTYPIVRTQGGVALAGKQRYHVKIGNSHYILPIQYNNRNVDKNKPNAAWVSYNPENWYNTDNTLITTDINTPPNKSKSFEQNCEGCHVTGLNISQNNSGEFVSDSKEIGISCERCHGPGGKHLATGGGKARYIVNPAYLSTDRGTEVCGQCHIRVVSKAGENGADFETEYPCIVDQGKLTPYIPGKVLKDYLEEKTTDGKPTASYWNDNDTSALDGNASENNHSKKHHQQYQDLVKSRHYNSVGHKCYTCHEPHDKGIRGTPQLIQSSNNNKLCTACHTDLTKTVMKNGKRYNKHAKHLYKSSNVGGSLCTGCHMPKTAKSGVDNDIASHVFDIIEPVTSKAMADYNATKGIPNNAGTVITNSCYGCHQDDTDYGVARWNKWKKGY